MHIRDPTCLGPFINHAEVGFVSSILSADPAGLPTTEGGVGRIGNVAALWIAFEKDMLRRICPIFNGRDDRRISDIFEVSMALMDWFLLQLSHPKAGVMTAVLA